MPLSWIFWLLAAISSTQASAAHSVAETKVDPTIESKSLLTFPVDLNQADLRKLMLLKGLGRKRAQAIIQYRKAHGLFHSMDDLSHIKGFSQKRLQTLMSRNQGKIATLH